MECLIWEIACRVGYSTKEKIDQCVKIILQYNQFL